MKKLIIAALLGIVSVSALTGCNCSDNILSVKNKAEPDYQKSLNLQVSDEFVFGYSNERLSHFTVSVKNKTGIVANEWFENKEHGIYRQIYLPYHDLYYSKNFTKIIVIKSAVKGN